MNLPLDQIANYSVAGLSIILFYLFATQVMKNLIKEIKKSVENNTQALQEIKEVMIRFKCGED